MTTETKITAYVYGAVAILLIASLSLARCSMSEDEYRGPSGPTGSVPGGKK